MRKLVVFFAFAVLILAVLCAPADAYLYLSVTGTKVNIRDAANKGGKVLTQANPGDTFIAEEKQVTNSADGSKWYKIVMSVGNGYVPLASDDRFGVAAAYISADFAHAMKLHEDEDKKIAEALASAAAADTKTGTTNRTIKVSDAREFLEALGSDRIIEMAPGEFNLSEWDTVLNNMPEQAPPYPNLKKEGSPKLAKGVSWSDDPFDGGELVLKGIKNLTILGWPGQQGNMTSIIIDPRYSFVLKFVNCSDIVIENLTAGHSEGSFCAGGVFSFDNSSRITITGASMFGCGTWGLELLNVSGMKVTGSRIYECTEGIVYASGGKNIAFENCEFTDNEGGLSVDGTTISISNSAFSRNNTYHPIEQSDNVNFKNCAFE